MGRVKRELALGREPIALAERYDAVTECGVQFLGFHLVKGSWITACLNWCVKRNKKVCGT